MKIRTKERLVTGTVFAVIGLIAVLIWWTHREVSVANGQRQQVGEIARTLSQLRLLTFEYRLYHNERAKVQWYAVSDRVDRLIENTQTSVPVQDQILTGIRERRVKVIRIFSELTFAGAGYRIDAPLDESTRLFEGMLISRLLAEQQDNFVDIFRLTDIATARINDAQQRLLFVSLAGLLLIALTKAFASWLINHDVLAPLVRLERATGEIGAGNWNFKFDAGGEDELGRLGTSFNAMVDRIEAQSTALQKAHDELELRVEERTAELVQSSKSVQTSKARMTGIVDSAMDAIISIDAEQKIVLFNAAAEKMFRCPAMAAMGQSIDMLVPRRFRDRHRHDIGAFGKTGVTSRSMRSLGTLYGLRADGEEFPIEASISQIEVSGHNIFTVILRDITERRQADEALRARDAAEAANRMKSEFLANMSHELRTPLNAIIGFTGTLLMKLPGPLNTDQEKQLKTVQTSARHLLTLINDLLDVAKIDAGKFAPHFESVACQSVIEEVAAMLRPEAARKGIGFNITVPDSEVVMRTDRRALHQIVLNLANNAVKFTDHGSVQLSVNRRGQNGGESVEISVEDTGTGIRMEDQEKLFEPFVQVDVSTRKPREGTGLGLHLSLKLAESLGGKITFRSEYGKGSTFTLSLSES